MPGPDPKPAHQRQRRNKTSTARRLPAELPKGFVAPDLPDLGRDWLEPTRQWWADVWSSPMAPEFIDGRADIHGLYMLAALVDEFWHDPTNAKLAAEIRLQRQCYGLTPIGRRRLQWEIERAEDAQDRGKRRRPAPQPSRQSDPRSVLHAV